jgi:siroheme synthase-like protein
MTSEQEEQKSAGEDSQKSRLGEARPSLRRSPRLTLIGIGPAGPAQLTQAAGAALRNAEVVIGDQPYADLVRPLLSVGQQLIVSPLGDELAGARQSIDLAVAGRQIALIGGDRSIYALAGLVFELLHERNWAGGAPEVEVLPSLSIASSPSHPARIGGAELEAQELAPRRTRPLASAPAPTYPISLTTLRGATVVIVGGGMVGERKLRGLLEAGAAVRLISPAATPDLRALADAGAIQWHARPYQAGDLAGARLVFAATDQRAVNQQVANEAAALDLLCNVADDPLAGSFHVPAVHRQPGLLVAVSTEGASPARAKRLRDQIAAWLAAGGAARS